YFRRSFKAAFGGTPYRYLMSRRERAKALLRAGELSITEVCHEVGFTSLGSFDQIGSGPPLILVSGAACDRRVDTPLAEVLAERFTVLNHDRRGRGDSEDTRPYTVAAGGGGH